VLAARLSEIGWFHLTGFLFLGQDGNQVDIMRAPIQELKQRTKRAWISLWGRAWCIATVLQG